MTRQFCVAQLGARMHYAVPRILEHAGMLERLFTDFSVDCGWPKLLNVLPKSLKRPAVQRLLTRTVEGVAPEKITAFNLLGLQYASKLRRSSTSEGKGNVFLWVGKEFCRRVLAQGFGEADAIYTFNTAGLELLQSARQRGLFAVMEQTIAPRQVEEELLNVERGRFSDWEPQRPTDASTLALAQREAAEWKEANLILCASDFVREGIGRCGGPVEKCVVVPYGIDLPAAKAGDKAAPELMNGKSRPLRVLTIGGVGLRKGSPYVLAAAKQMKGKAEFRIVGGIGVPAAIETRLREQVELTGIVSRAAIHEHFAWADVFLLPSLCEGSATVTYEALAHGLPVICTPNTGSVVRDGRDGYIVPAGDLAAIVERLDLLHTKPELLSLLSNSARLTAAEFTVAAYGRRLVAVLGGQTVSTA